MPWNNAGDVLGVAGGAATVTFNPVNPAPIGTGTPNTGAFTTLSASGVFTSTVTTGTAPLVINSTTVVPNLNAGRWAGNTGTTSTAKGDLMAATAAGAFGILPVGINGQYLICDSTAATGLKWQTSGAAFDPASPGPIGGTTPSTGVFTTLTATTWFKSTSDNNGDGSNILVNTTTKSTALYAVEVQRSGSNVAGFTIGGAMNAQAGTLASLGVTGAATVGTTLAVTGTTSTADLTVNATASPGITLNNSAAQSYLKFNSTRAYNTANQVGLDCYMLNASAGQKEVGYLVWNMTTGTAGSETTSVQLGSMNAGTLSSVLSFAGRDATFIRRVMVNNATDDGSTALQVTGNASLANSAVTITMAGSANTGARILWTAGSGTVYNWLEGHNWFNASAWEIGASSAVGGSTYSKPWMSVYGATGNVVIGGGSSGDNGNDALQIRRDSAVHNVTVAFDDTNASPQKWLLGVSVTASANGHFELYDSTATTLRMRIAKTTGVATFSSTNLTLTNSTSADTILFSTNLDTTHGAYFRATCGNGTTSARFAAMQVVSSETSGQSWTHGMYGAKDWSLRDDTSGRVPLSILQTNGQLYMTAATQSVGFFTRASGSDVGIALDQSGVSQWQLYNKATSGSFAIAQGGSDRLTINTSGGVTVGTTLLAGSTITTDGSVVIDDASGGGGNARLLLMVNTGAGTKTNWRLGAQVTTDGAFEIGHSTSVGGSTYTTDLLINNSGNATFSGTVAMVGGTSTGLFQVNRGELTNSGSYGLQVMQEVRASTNGTYSPRALSVSLAGSVVNGITDSGYRVGVWCEVFRNASASIGGTGDSAGVLANIYGAVIKAGHLADTGAAPQTTTITACEIDLYCGTGSVTTAYALNVAPNASTGATVTTKYGIFIDNCSGATTNYALYTNTGIVRFGDQVQLASMAAPTSVDGQLWNDSTRKALMTYAAGVKQALVGVIAANTNWIGVAGTGEASIIPSLAGTATLPANLLVSGKAVRIRLSGMYSTGGTPGTLVLKVKRNTTAMFTLTTPTLPTSISAAPFNFEWTIACKTASNIGPVGETVSFLYCTSTTAGTNLYLGSGSVANAIDTTGTIALDVTATLSQAGSTITTTCCTIEILN